MVTKTAQPWRPWWELNLGQHSSSPTSLRFVYSPIYAYECSVSKNTKRGNQSHTDGCEPPRRCWEPESVLWKGSELPWQQSHLSNTVEIWPGVSSFLKLEGRHTLKAEVKIYTTKLVSNLSYSHPPIFWEHTHDWLRPVLQWWCMQGKPPVRMKL